MHVNRFLNGKVLNEKDLGSVNLSIPALENAVIHAKSRINEKNSRDKTRFTDEKQNKHSLNALKNNADNSGSGDN